MTDWIGRNGASTVTRVITLKYVQVQVQKMTVNENTIFAFFFSKSKC